MIASPPFQNTETFADQLDLEDSLSSYRSQFIFPHKNNRSVIYFAGNSLGLQPKITKDYVDEVMNDWANLAVAGHFEARKPWWVYHEQLAEPLAKIVGAAADEITVMNTLTVNLHLLFVSFYRPTKDRHIIICEEKAFPSDQYLLKSQVRYHGYDPETAIVTIKKRKGEHHFRTEDILQTIDAVGQRCALVFMGGVQYYNGQVLDIPAITSAAHQIGAYAGWDLAHAVGNIELRLREWQIDFASWCSYKYMNAGPGNASGCYINSRYLNQKSIPRFEGWWGTQKASRFLMQPEFMPMPNADAWQLSNAPVLSLAPYLASLQLFEEVGMKLLIAKRIQQGEYLLFLLQSMDANLKNTFEIITPIDRNKRGAQISILLKKKGKAIFNHLIEKGIVLDWREPDVIRLAPTPFYSSFKDIYNFCKIFEETLLEQEKK